MRISIVGLPGSGKTYFAEAISKKLSIPHIHLDRFWFESGGRNGSYDTPNIEDVRAKVRARTLEAIRADSWVSDGVYLRVQTDVATRADAIIFLDIALWARLLNHAKRMFRPRTRHKELSLWDEITFFREIVRRTYSSGPKLRQFVEEHKNKVVTLRSRKEMQEYLSRLK